MTNTSFDATAAAPDGNSKATKDFVVMIIPNAVPCRIGVPRKPGLILTRTGVRRGSGLFRCSGWSRSYLISKNPSAKVNARPCRGWLNWFISGSYISPTVRWNFNQTILSLCYRVLRNIIAIPSTMSRYADAHLNRRPSYSSSNRQRWRSSWDDEW